MMAFVKKFILLLSFAIIVSVLTYLTDRMFSGSIKVNPAKPKIQKEQPREDTVRKNMSVIKDSAQQQVDGMITYANRKDVYMVNGASVLAAVVYDLPDTDSTLLRSLKLYLKTLAIFNKQLIDVILVMNKNEYKVAEIIKDWPENYRRRLNITIVQPWYPTTKFRDGFTRICGVERLLFAQMFPRLSYALYTDVDVAFLRPVSDLFQEFEAFSSTQFMGGAGLTTYCPKHLSKCYNSGFILMNLTRMRDYPVYFPDLVTGIMKSEGLGDDQKILNAIIRTHPQIFKALPAEWDVVLAMCTRMKVIAKEGFQFDGWSMIHGSSLSYFKIPDFMVVTKVLEDWEMGSNEEALVKNLEKATKALVDDNSTPLRCDRARLVDWVTYYPKKTLL